MKKNDHRKDRIFAQAPEEHSEGSLCWEEQQEVSRRDRGAFSLDAILSGKKCHWNILRYTCILFDQFILSATEKDLVFLGNSNKGCNVYILMLIVDLVCILHEFLSHKRH